MVGGKELWMEALQDSSHMVMLRLENLHIAVDIFIIYLFLEIMQ